MIRLINIFDLDFSYGNREILKKLNIEIEKREFVGIIGPNGSGKSTLLKNISNVLEPKSGLVYLDKRVLNDYNSRELARKMAVVPQDTAMNFDFKVIDLVMLGRNPYQNRWGKIKSEDKRIVRQAMELTDTSRLKDKQVNSLSGGEKQRVIIARALAQKPEILLLDEPTSSLDINYQGEIFDLLSYLNKELEITIILVSHDLNLTGQYCERLLLLNEGKIFAEGSPKEVLKRDIISRVYQTEVIVKENPLTNRPFVTIIPKSLNKSRDFKKKDVKIHIICGGGTGKKLMRKLDDRGYKLSCGVLNQGDADWETARRLNMELVEIPPFLSIDEKHLRENKKLLQKADLIVVSDTPFGYGNTPNLKSLTEIKKKIVLITERDFSERDYTDGLASKYWHKIVDRNHTYQADNIKDTIKYIEKIT